MHAFERICLLQFLFNQSMVTTKLIILSVDDCFSGENLRCPQNSEKAVFSSHILIRKRTARSPGLEGVQYHVQFCWPWPWMEHTLGHLSS